MRRKATLHLGTPLARLLREKAERSAMTLNDLILLLIRRGMSANQLAVFEVDGQTYPHGLVNLTPTTQEGRVCVYFPQETYQELFKMGDRFPELAEAHISATVRCLIYAGMQE